MTAHSADTVRYREALQVAHDYLAGLPELVDYYDPEAGIVSGAFVLALVRMALKNDPTIEQCRCLTEETCYLPAHSDGVDRG